MELTDLPLFDSYGAPLVLPVCEHIAGSIQFAEKALLLQKEFAASKSKAPFDITLDLEDGAAVGNEISLCDSFIKLINSEKNSFKQLGIRIHDLTSTFWEEELVKIAKEALAHVAYIKIPKIQHPKELTRVRDLILRNSPAKKVVQFHAVVESIEAFNHVDAIAADPWVSVLDFGLMDFISDHAGVIPAACMRSPGQFDHELIKRAKTELVAACVRHRKVASHNVTILAKDIEAAKSDALTARSRFGFLRMWSIHPSQIKPIIEAMSPQASEIQEAEKIIEAAKAANFGPIYFGGRLHDRASYRYYADLLRRATQS